MRYLHTLLRLAVLAALLTSFASLGQAQRKNRTHAAQKTYTAPAMEYDRGMGAMMIISELWLSHESWRFGMIDKHRYFLVMQPGHAVYKKGFPPWLVWAGRKNRLRRLVMQRDPEFASDGTVVFRTSSGTFIFPVPSRNTPATYNGKELAIPNLEFGPGIPVRKMPRPLPGPDSCPLPPSPKP